MALILLVSGFALQVVRLWQYKSGKDHPQLAIVAYYVLGLLSHLFIFTVMKDVVVIGMGFLPLQINIVEFDMVASMSTLGLSFALNTWGVITALKGPIVRRVTISARKAKPIKVVQISDLHVGPIIKKKYVENVVKKVNLEKPDLIVLTGDIGDGFPELLKKDFAPLGLLKAAYGVYYVTGNHEYYWSAGDWIQSLGALGIKPLINEGVKIREDVWLGGVTDVSSHGFLAGHVSDPIKAAAPSDFKGLKMLLAHQPKSCFVAERAGFDVMLSGHTHWGQFFPFTLFVGFFNPYSKSLNRHHAMWVYINAGTGFWGPPVRLGVPSEVTSISIT